MASASSVIAVTFKRCPHLDKDIKIMKTIAHSKFIADVFLESHEQAAADKPHGFTARCSSFINRPNESFEIEGLTAGTSAMFFSASSGMSIGTLVNRFDVKCVEFTCTSTSSTNDGAMEILQETNRKAVNAFQLMMAGGRQYAEKKSSSSDVKDGLSRKDELFNNLVDDFRKQGLDWPRSMVSSDAIYFIQVLTNALWYLTNHHNVVNDAALMRKDVNPIPEIFSSYTGYNNVKRKKMKGQQMSQTELGIHSQALYSLLLKPVVKSTPAWNQAFSNIKDLADCMDSYKNYLKEQLNIQIENQKQTHPCKPISEYATIEHKKKVNFVAHKYSCIDKVMTEADTLAPVLFDESVHLENRFEDSKQRLRYFEELFLTVSVYILRYCPGGSRTTTFYLFKCSNNPSEAQLLIEGARLLHGIQSKLGEVHTRAQRAEFKDKVNLITTISPAVRDFIYNHLTSDGSATSNPVMQERLRLISLGNTEIVDDLRHLNSGRPKAFDPFFDKLEEVVEEVTAADERRHNIAHLSQWFSVEELIATTKSRLPDGTAIPSPSTVRLQFAPRNPYTRTALFYIKDQGSI